MAALRGRGDRATMLLVPPPPRVMPSPGPSPALPDGAALLALEDGARRRGSGLGITQLCGCWRLEQVWPKGAAAPSALNGVLLRGLGARLEIAAAGDAAAGPAPLQLRNAVRLGQLELCFHGSGWLQGRRPLLLFSFERLELRLGSWRVLSRALPVVPPRRQPFFALIARGEGWLAARGRGGGLALWQLQA